MRVAATDVLRFGFDRSPTPEFHGPRSASNVTRLSVEPNHAPGGRAREAQAAWETSCGDRHGPGRGARVADGASRATYQDRARVERTAGRLCFRRRSSRCRGICSGPSWIGYGDSGRPRRHRDNSGPPELGPEAETSRDGLRWASESAVRTVKTCEHVTNTSPACWHGALRHAPTGATAR